MRAAVTVCLVAATAALAHDHGIFHRNRDPHRGQHHQHVARQQDSTTLSAPAVPTIPTVPAVPSVPAVPTTPSPPSVPTVTPPTGTTPTTPAPVPPVVVPSTPAAPPGITGAPGALPLDKIVPSSVQATDPSPSTLPTTAPGARPVGLPNAPALPDISGWSALNYPAADVVPDTKKPQVIKWIQEVRDSGVVIPDIRPHEYGVDGSNCDLPSNLPRVNNDTECWWTCGHCVRKTDIVECLTPKTWGSSFDDGPSPDTPKLLHYLEQEKIKTTFFVIGSRVVHRPEYLRTQYLLGHQIAVHGWSHTAMTSQSSEQVIAELAWTKQVIKDAIGVTPLLFRPPYGDGDDRIRAISKALNLTPVMWTVGGTDSNPIAFDSFDYEVPGGWKTAAQSVAQFDRMLQEADTRTNGFIVLMHDLFWQQVELAVGYFLPGAKQRGYRITPISTCMNQQLADTYSETNTKGGIPSGSGLGRDAVFVGQVAPKNAPLGGSDGSNTDILTAAGGYEPEGSGKDSGERTQDRIMWSFVAAVTLSGVLTIVPTLL